MRAAQLSLSLWLPLKVNLATEINSLPNVSKLTIEKVRLHSYYGLSAGSFMQRIPTLSPRGRMVSGSFHLLLRILFSFRSPYLFAIGLGLYLGFALIGGGLSTPYPRSGTLDTRYHPSSFSYGALTLFGTPFQGISHLEVRQNPGPNPTSPCTLMHGFGLPCSLFVRHY